MPTQDDIRTRVTQQIVNALKAGGLPPWRIPWRPDPHVGAPANVVTRRPYTGVNPMLLTIASKRHGFQSRWWATFRQWQELGGNVVRRPVNVPSGEWGASILYCRPVRKAPDDDEFLLLRRYTVFNIDQVEGDFCHLRAGHVTITANEVQQRYEQADDVIEATGADIRFGGNRAIYNWAEDYILMPHRHQFVLPEYYETLAHELTHWTEHPRRLNWDRKQSGYALGELIAELGGCYFAAELGLPYRFNDRPSLATIMPHRHQFVLPEYYETLAHELTHWTEHPRRLNWDRKQSGYALGELIAELGGCYFAAELGLPMREANHAAYLKQWLDSMGQDPRFIFKAAAQASKAVDFLLSFSRQPREAVTS